MKLNIICIKFDPKK